MTFWTAVVVIVGIIALAEVIKAKHYARHGITKDMMGNQKLAAHESAQLEQEVIDLRERIKVLERIATEERDTKRLAAEIESLRDN